MHALVKRFAVLALPLSLLAACGGGGSDDGPGRAGPAEPASCSVDAQKTWLADYMDEWYFWYRLSPRPDPAGYASVESYFDALLYTGTSSAFPADRWSYSESTVSFNRFFGEGRSLGFGISVAGLEVAGQPERPLYVRQVEPQSDAALRGVVRGDRVLRVNGREARDLIAANDFGAFVTDREGATLTLLLQRPGGPERTVTVTATSYPLTPVQDDRVVITPQGRRLGYVQVQNMVSQAEAPLAAAFARFRGAGVDGVVLDLRYNGGGLVSVAGTVASYVAGAAGNGRVFASLLYNDKRAAANNQTYTFTTPPSSISLQRVYVLTGPRTCSASEQVINGLRGIGVDVVSVGGATCGKPVGFLPRSSCGTTYSVVNFESVNARNEGRYFDGFAATCPVAEDFTQPLGTRAEPLLAAAARFADTGNCPAAAVGQALPQRQALSAQRRALLRATEPGERQGMVGR